MGMNDGRVQDPVGGREELSTSAAGVEGRQSRPRRLPSLGTLRYLLIGWLILTFFATHWPDVSRFEPEGGWPIPDFDKFAHFGMYAVWGVLWWLVFLVSRGSVGRSVMAWVFTGGAAWAVFDECTQAIVGRTPDIMDFACDMGGLLASLIVFRLYVRRTGDPGTGWRDGNTSA